MTNFVVLHGTGSRAKIKRWPGITYDITTVSDGLPGETDVLRGRTTIGKATLGGKKISVFVPLYDKRGYRRADAALKADVQREMRRILQ